jgi:hypothetical protein
MHLTHAVKIKIGLVTEGPDPEIKKAVYGNMQYRSYLIWLKKK